MKHYLNSLIRKHRKLDTQIAKARDDVAQLRELKKLRLHLKDHIQQLRRGPTRNQTFGKTRHLA